MGEFQRENIADSDIDSVLLDVDLFIKYNAPDRAVTRLRTALEGHPRSIQLRERLRQLLASTHPDESARQCLALASLYIENEDFQTAHDRLLEAKQRNPRINIAPGLNAIKRARRRESARPIDYSAPQPAMPHDATLAGDISIISIFDAVQVLENARLTGELKLQDGGRNGRILFNEGRIVGAETDARRGEEAFRQLIEVNEGVFVFTKSRNEFPVTINSSSNTNLLLDSLRQLDEEKM